MKAIVYTQRVEIIESYNERRDCVDQRIAEFIRACGFLPIPVPNIPAIAREIVEEINPAGLILVGGNSLVKYGGNAPERDATDQVMIDLARERKFPLYGFCRGMQSILDYFGNNLVKVQGHVAVRHVISGIEDNEEVNSFHNEACIELCNDDLLVIMRAADGIVEKVKHRKLPIVGTMWHPEREKPFREKDILLVKEMCAKE